MNTIICNGKEVELIPVNVLPTIDKCPSCGGEVGRDGPRVICYAGSSCSGVLVKRIKKWIDKREIMFFGDSTLEKLTDATVVNSIRSLYTLTQDQLEGAGLGKRMSEKILGEIEKSTNVSLADFLGSLSIDMLGRREASNLVSLGFDTLEKWENMTPSALSKLDGFQSTKANRICGGVKNSWSEIQGLRTYLKITIPKKKTAPASGSVVNKSFCFTGKMERSRKELEGMAESNGGTVASVSKGLDFLVIADVNSTSSKAVKAKKLGITLISEIGFLDLVG